MAVSSQGEPRAALPQRMGNIMFPTHPADTPEGAREYKVLPRPWAVLGFQYRGRLSVVRESGAELLGRSGITGLQHEFRLFQPQPRTSTIIVNLKPQAAYRLLGCPMDELANDHVPLDAILNGSTVRELERRIAEAPSIDEAAHIISAFVTRMYEGSRYREHRAVAAVVDDIIVRSGARPIEQLAADAGLSRRHLERLFRVQVGVSPKRLASIARFDWAAGQLAAGRRPSDLAYDAGYADQAHFIRSFARQAGVTPGAAARDRPD